MTDLVKQWKLLTRQDDLFNHMVPSDVRQLVGDIERLRELISDLVNDDACVLDHHGYCQAHGWTETDILCPNARGLALLAELKK